MENINIGNSGRIQRKIFIEKRACPKMGRKGPECALKWGGFISFHTFLPLMFAGSNLKLKDTTILSFLEHVSYVEKFWFAS